MKGIELPINILVIVAVAIIVLLGVVALFYSSWFTGTGPVTSQTAVSKACAIATRIGCTADPTTVYMTDDGTAAGTPIYKTYVSLDGFCVGEYQLAAGSGTTCLKMACGLQCT